MMNIAAFLLINIAFGPVAVLLAFNRDIARDLGSSPAAVTALYGLFFIAGGVTGRLSLSHNPPFSFISANIMAACALAVGSLICAWLAGSYFFFAFSFLFISGAMGIYWFLAPICSHIQRRSMLGPATSLAIATVGQLTALGTWQAVFFIARINEWRMAFTVVAGTLILFIYPLARIIEKKSSVLQPQATKQIGERRVLPGLIAFGLVAFVGTSLIMNLSQPIGSDSSPFRPIIFSCAAILGRPIAGLLYDHGHRRIALVGCSSFVTFAALIQSTNVQNEFLLFFAAGCLGLGYGGFLPVAVVFLGDRKPSRRVQTMATLFYISASGIAAASALPLLADFFAYQIAVLFFVSSIISFFLWLLLAFG